jgi:amino acid adenylation domain-containing protein
MTVPGLFQSQVSRNPDEIAISVGATRITYSELDEWSDRVAWRIVGAGVAVGAAVAVSAGRSPTYVAAVLGILKAGCAYVPLDPGYPADRREFILRDSGAQILLGPPDPALTPIPQMPLPAFSEPAPAGRISLPAYSHDRSAYVMYTSGSTGTPKGVVVQHRQIAALARNDERVRVAPGERVAMFAPLSFDASTFELWNALCGGGNVVIFDRANDSVQELGDQVRLHRPDWLFLTTGLFHLVAEYDPAAFDAVRRLITGGDVLSPKYVQRVAARRTAQILAAYGPTETTTFASLHEVNPDDETSTVPIGRPLAGVTMCVLDAEQRPLPQGAVGEIYIGGTGVAAGYHANPALTAVSFVPDVSGRCPGARMYRTGDLARQLVDGSFEFHGRIDRQVKIRGHRVEPGEIEVQLANHPQLAATVVCAVEDPSGARRLVAYVVPGREGELRVADLKKWLAGRLPDYMQPASIIPIAELPLDSNGKPDRKALPDPWTCRDQLPGLGPFSSSDSSTERAVASIWAESLGLDQVGLDDDFYLLGGDSLRSVDVIARMRQHGFKVSAMAFFRNPTVRQLAASLDTEPAVTS